MKHAQNIFESLLVFHNIFSLDDRMNLRSMLLSERFRRAEEGMVRQIRNFCAYRIEEDDASSIIRNNSQYIDLKSF